MRRLLPLPLLLPAPPPLPLLPAATRSVEEEEEEEGLPEPSAAPLFTSRSLLASLRNTSSREDREMPHSRMTRSSSPSGMPASLLLLLLLLPPLPLSAISESSLRKGGMRCSAECGTDTVREPLLEEFFMLSWEGGAPGAA